MRIGVVGDPHGSWGPADNHFFDRAGYDLILVTGDLGAGTERSALDVTRLLARMRTPTLIMLGNNDAYYAPTIAAELQHFRGLSALGQVSRAQQHPIEQPAHTALCGYSQHVLTAEGPGLALIAARPMAMGGDVFSYPERLEELYGVRDAEESTERLLAEVSACEARRLVFFAHNGPRGLGEEPDAMWGCDFMPDGGDYGDADLAAAVTHATQLGKQVLAVVAGHMHLRTKQGRERPAMLQRGGTLYINAARVPRVFARADGPVRHHVSLDITAGRVEAREVFVPEE